MTGEGCPLRDGGGLASAAVDTAGHFCGQTQPHHAHKWRILPAYGSAGFVVQYQCAGFAAADEPSDPPTGGVLPCCRGEGACQAPPDIGPCAPLPPTGGTGAGGLAESIAADEGPECETCGKADCPDAALPEFSEPRDCIYAPVYHALRDAKDCDYGCARDYTNQAIRLEVVAAVERIVAAHVEALRDNGR